MGRAANLSISQWYGRRCIESRPWVAHAQCGRHQELPWIADTRPPTAEFEAMAQVCADCPVAAACAGYGLTTAGGFYAGVWLPWHTTNDIPERRLIRRRARDDLRRIAAQPVFA